MPCDQHWNCKRCREEMESLADKLNQRGARHAMPDFYVDVRPEGGRFRVWLVLGEASFAIGDPRDNKPAHSLATALRAALRGGA